MSKKQNKEQLEFLVHSYAQTILALPYDQRESCFAQIRIDTYAYAIADGMSHVAATKRNRQIEKLTRTLVIMIESSGGASGGSA